MCLGGWARVPEGEPTENESKARIQRPSNRRQAVTSEGQSSDWWCWVTHDVKWWEDWVGQVKKKNSSQGNKALSTQHNKWLNNRATISCSDCPAANHSPPPNWRVLLTSWAWPKLRKFRAPCSNFKQEWEGKKSQSCFQAFSRCKMDYLSINAKCSWWVKER